MAVAQIQGDGLVRVTVVLGTRRTSVSIDSELFGYLSELVGGAERSHRWIEAEARLQDTAGTEPGVKSGLSRLVQKRVIRVLLGREPLGHGLDPLDADRAHADNRPETAQDVGAGD